MINKVSAQWNGIGGSVDQVGGRDDVDQLVGHVQNVRDVLKKMCQVSVTRTSLKNAVREALAPVIEEYREELFPEVAELRRRLEAAGEDGSVLDIYRGKLAVPEEVVTRLDDFEARIAKLSELEAKFRKDVVEVDERLTVSLAAAEARQEQKLDEVTKSLDEDLQTKIVAADIRLQAAEENVSKAEENLARLETTVPEVAGAAAREVESRLREEMDDMVERLTGKLGEVKEILERMETFVARKEAVETVNDRLETIAARVASIEESVPHREAVESVDQRLARLESQFEKVSEEVGGTVAPEIRGLGERFAGLRQQINLVSQSLDHTTGEVRESLGQRLDELQQVLRDGIDRWEKDQSQVHGRLGVLRDSLRDEVGVLSDQVSKAKASFWGKVSGKKDAGLKLSGGDFDTLSSKLEGIVTGLEAIIAQKKS